MVRGSGRKRGRSDDRAASNGAATRMVDDEVTSEEEDDDDFGRLPEDDAEGEDEPRARETAEQKRLRIAKAYIQSIKPREGEREDGGDEDDDRDAVAERLKVDALQERGHFQRQIVDLLEVPAPSSSRRIVARPFRDGGGNHPLPLTAVAVSDADEAHAFTVSKDGSLVGWDVEAGTRRFAFTKRVRDHLRAKAAGGEGSSAGFSDRKPALLTVAVSGDGNMVATGGVSKAVGVWDARSGDHIADFPGHKGSVTGLAFQKGTNQLFSCSADRTIKIWSLDDMAYVDTLYGHVSEVNALDCLRKERVVSVGTDRSCRIWKVPEETQLLFKGHAASTDSCALIGPTTFVTGSQDGSLALWSMFKKRAVHTVPRAHEAGPGQTAGAGWVGAVAACPHTDLVASGAGNGVIKLWGVRDAGKRQELSLHSELAVAGYVNGLAFSKNASYLVAAVGQEPRLGRWGREKGSKNSLFIQRLKLTSS